VFSGRQPYGVLFLQLPPDRVDPNVHPTKSDVRLRDASAVSQGVREAIATTLRRDAQHHLLRSVSFGPPPPPVSSQSEADQPERTPSFAFDGQAIAQRTLRVLAQLDDTFILATDGQALVLIDQHAAHERIAFEAIARRASGATASEPLLLPYMIEIDSARHARLESARAALADAGLELEPFGERTYRVVATPAGYGARALDLRGFIDDLADDAPGLGARERLWASLACHSVVRAGEALEHAEMMALIGGLTSCENPMHCPHGRPTIVRIEADAIARMFKRA